MKLLVFLRVTLVVCLVVRAELKVLAGFPSTTVWILSVPLKDVCAKACSGAWHCRVVMDTGKPALVRSVGFCLVGG